MTYNQHKPTSLESSIISKNVQGPETLEPLSWWWDRNEVSRKEVPRAPDSPPFWTLSELFHTDRELHYEVASLTGGTAQPAAMAEDSLHCAWRRGQQTALCRGGGSLPKQVGCAGPSPCKTSICLATWLNKWEKKSPSSVRCPTPCARAVCAAGW